MCTVGQSLSSWMTTHIDGVGGEGGWWLKLRLRLRFSADPLLLASPGVGHDLGFTEQMSSLINAAQTYEGA